MYVNVSQALLSKDPHITVVFISAPSASHPVWVPGTY